MPKRGLIVDSFCGGGGTSEGAKRALGRCPDIAINHNAKAIAMHMANHPETRHFCGSIYDAEPAEVCGDNDVDAAWFSPDCTDFSKAKNGKPKRQNIRGLAWVVVNWARTVRPKVLFVENVEEFQEWGPLGDDDLPIESRKGETFRQWVGALESLGYVVEWRELVAADYGAPTLRKRLFVIARCDGERIAWPRPTHGKGCARPWRSTAEIIDWTIECPSIFERGKSLAMPTMRRIAHGVHRYVLGTDRPYMVGEHVAASLVHSGNGEREGQSPRVYDITKPIGTIVASAQKHRLVAAFITKHYGGVVGHDVHRPLGTITSQDHHALTTAALDRGEHEAEATALLERFPAEAKYTHRGRLFELVDGPRESLRIYDIGSRMLTPRELYNAQGFGRDYIIDLEVNRKRLSLKDQIAMCGNSVAPDVATAIFGANVEQRAAVAA